MTYLDIHCLQSVPFANLNRDDTGSPKTAIFGGVPRIRISSQAQKRPTRLDLAETLGDGADPVTLTRQHAEHLSAAIEAKGLSAQDAAHVARVILNPGKGFPKDKVKDDDKGGESPTDAEPDTSGSRVLMFLTESQYEDLATYGVEHAADLLAAPWDKTDPKGKEFKAHRAALEEVIIEPRGLVRLFGRMLAHLPAANTDSAIQVAHALTVHEAIPEPDYLTAVDDLVEHGAGGIFSADFASGTFYRYASVNLGTLERNGLTHDEAVTLACEVAAAFVKALPKGKQTSTAAQVRPDLVVLQVRDNPANLVNAFERPIRPSEDGYVGRAASELAKYAGALAESFDEMPSASAYVWASTQEAGDLDALGSKTSLGGALDIVRQAL